MCIICRKFKKGTWEIGEAREQLEEQMEYLTEEHIEEIEEMLLIAEDKAEYMSERARERLEYDDDSEELIEGDDLELPEGSDNSYIEEDE
jgi:cell division protein FtsB